MSSLNSSMNRSARGPPYHNHTGNHQQHQQQSRLNPQQHQIIQQQNHHSGNGSGKPAIEEIISSQVTLRRDVMRHDESVQAVRQENIMLAEKVQQATNLYRQLLNRVGKTEERMEMENKSMSNILSQAKQVETQLVNQQEKLNNKEAQLHIQVQKLQEEMSIMKVERDQMKKVNQSIGQDLRQLQEKLARQGGALSSGLQDLKAHLDQKDLEKSQSFNVLFNELREKVETQDHQRSMFQTQVEGRIETVKLQATQNEKQRQDDVYQLQTTIREKEALTKADVRRLQEKFRDVFEEFSKSIMQKDSKLRQDMDSRFQQLDSKLSADTKNLERKFRELEEENAANVQEMKLNIVDEIELIKSKTTPAKEESDVDTDQLQNEVKLLERQIKQNKQDIEKVVRAEIQSRLSQGDKLSRQVNDVHKDYNEGLSMIQQTLADQKRKQNQAIETTRKDLLRMFNEQNKEDPVDERRVQYIEKKIEEMEDALDEFAKQEERIDMNSEQVKQMEMENILALGDLQNLIESNGKRMQKIEQNNTDKVEEVVRQIERDRNKTPRPSTAMNDLKEHVKQLMNKYDIMPSQVKLVEKKLHYLAQAFEDYKKQEKNMSQAMSSSDGLGDNGRTGTPLPIKKDRFEKLEIRLNNVKETVNILKDVLTEKINDEHSKNKRDVLLQKLKKQLDELNMIKEKNDEEEEESSSEDDAEDKEKDSSGDEKADVKEKSDDDDDEDDEEDDDDDDDDDDDEDDDDEDDDDEDDDNKEESDDDEDDDDDDDDEKAPNSARSSVLELALTRESTMETKSPTPPKGPPPAKNVAIKRL